MIDGVIEKLADRDNSAPSDYEKDGVRFCGVCHQPKQAKVELDGEMRLVPVACACEEVKGREEQEAIARKLFLQKIDALQAEYGITDNTYRRMVFSQDDGKNPRISNVCRRYVERWEEMKADNLGMLFYGTCGTGKSFFACSIANALLEKRVYATVTNFPRLLNLLQGARDRQELIDHLQRYDLLVIDDLGVERDSSYAVEQVFNVIDARARSSLPLIVTTNMTLDELKNPPSMQYARIYDRVLELCPITLKMTGESRRAGNAEARRSKAREILGE
ncbi:MAG: ATP-binding protein [Faecousia sp.]